MSRVNRRRQAQGQENDEQPDKELIKKQKSVADFLKSKCQTKQTIMEGHGKVEYFTSSKAVDVLMDSKFATGEKPLFTTRESVVKFLDQLLRNEYFIRAEKITVKKVERGEKAGEKSETDSPSSPAATGSDSPAAGGGKKKKKVKLEMHDNQRFVDGNNAYVWLYNPTSTLQMILGILLVIGSIGLCLFPLWPASVRQGVYYLTMTLAGLVGSVLVIGVLRYIPFAAVWVMTAGKTHFWIFPNLLEDVGILESFQPVYVWEMRGPGGEKESEAIAQEPEEEVEEFEIIDEDSIQ